MNKRELYSVFKTAFFNWLRGGATMRAAALTFFIILPLPTLLLIVNVVFGQIFGEARATQMLTQQISAVAGPAVTELFSKLIANTASPFTSSWTTLVVVGFSVAGAVGAFAVLRDSINNIWQVKLPSRQPFLNRLRHTVLPFVLITALGLIVIAWTAVAGGVFNAIEYFSVNTILTFVALGIAQVLTSFGLVTLLLAITYRMLPQVELHWPDVALAALVTGMAFTAADYLFGAYVQVFVVTTVAGAAGALLIILLWIFVLTEIVLYGAELSKVYVTTAGSHSKQQVLPESVERFVLPLQKAGRFVERVTKGDVVNAHEPSDEEKGEDHTTEKPKNDSE